jgi:diadenosine tetraphosphate (Ap4A) HIT family hydrolase
MPYDPNNIFAHIIKGELPCNKVYEDDHVIAFHDLHPAAPLHVLILPKGEYCSFDDFVLKATSSTVHNFYLKIREIAHSLGLAQSGYRLIMNHGPHASQTVEHYHVHLLGKRHLGALVAGDIHHA